MHNMQPRMLAHLSVLHADSRPWLASQRHPLLRWDPFHAKSRRNSTMFDSGMLHSSEAGSSQCISFLIDWNSGRIIRPNIPAPCTAIYLASNNTSYRYAKAVLLLWMVMTAYNVMFFGPFHTHAVNTVSCF